MASSSGKVKKLQYPQENMQEALENVKNGEMTASEAARKFNVKLSTLYDRLKGKHDGKRGTETILSHAEELRLVSWIEDYAKIGQPLSQNRFMDAAKKLAELHKDPRKRFQDSGPSRKWLNSFMERHPTVTLRHMEAVSRAAANVTSSNIDWWFDKLTDYLESNDLLNYLQQHPENFINIDETGLDLNPKAKKALTTKNIPHAYKKNPGLQHERVSASVAVAADGFVFTPQVMVKSSQWARVSDFLFASGVEKTLIQFSKTTNGWQETDAFKEYLIELDLQQRGRGVKGPYLVFVDGHKTHMNLQLYEWCKSKGIIYVVLYPNVTHVLQPLDLTVFRSFKSYYASQLEDYMVQHRKTEIDMIDFIKIFSRSIRGGLKAEIIKNGFKSAGLFPLNRANVHDERLLGASINNQVPDQRDSNQAAAQVDSRSNFLPTTSPNTQHTSQSNLGIVTTPINLSPDQILAQMIEMQKLFHQSIDPRDENRLTSSKVVELQLQMLLNLPPPVTIDTILEPPPPNTRKGRKRPRVDGCGVMSDEATISKLKKIQEDAQKEEERKAAGRAQREAQKQLRALIPKKPRGRPPKNVQPLPTPPEISEEDSDEEN